MTTNNKHTVDSLSLEVEEQKLIIEELRNELNAMNEYNQQRIRKIEDTLDEVESADNYIDSPNFQPF